MFFSARCVAAHALSLTLILLLPMSVLGDVVPVPADSVQTVQPTEFIVVDGDTLFLTEPMEIVGSRVPAALPGVVRTVDMLWADEIQAAPGRSAAEVLQTMPGVVTGQRQQYGVQSDLSIRGSTFEQVQVLLDGYDLDDPQTGHHLMDLPVGKQDIARLEVLPGHGSALYGSGAFGGTVNVVTRRPQESAAAELALLGGAGGTWGARGSATARLDASTGLRLSAETFATDGHDVLQDDGSEAWGANDAETWTATARLNRTTGNGEWDLLAGHASREFGALDFYAPFASSERTRSLFTAARYTRSLSDRVTIEPRVHYRRHTDLFVLFRDNPDVYTNDHVSRRAGGDLRGIVDLGRRLSVAVGVEGVYEDIDSRGLRGGTWADALGSHLRRRFSTAVEIDGNQAPVRWQLGGRIDARQGFLPRYSTTGAAAADLASGFSARVSAGSIFRLPTFTDLYYVSDFNIGNPDLRPEKGWTWDGGLQWHHGSWHGRASYFERYERDVIDWARIAGTDPQLVPWQVMNIAESTVQGSETYLSWRHGVGHTLSLAWTWLQKESTLPATHEGKYTLLVPRQILVLQARAVLTRNLSLAAVTRYLEHSGGPDDFRRAFVLDSRLNWECRCGWFASLSGTNLLDRRYEEVPGVQMPGRRLVMELGRRI